MSGASHEYMFTWVEDLKAAPGHVLEWTEAGWELADHSSTLAKTDRGIVVSTATLVTFVWKRPRTS